MAEEPYHLLRVALGMLLSWVIMWEERIPHLRGISLLEKKFLPLPHQLTGLSTMIGPGFHARQDGAA